MIRRVALALESLFDQITVVGGDHNRIQQYGLRWVPDLCEARGVLGGLHSGLVHADSSMIFLCGCDMPMILPEVIEVVMQHSSSRPITLPVIAGKRQPLHAVYHKSILPVVERILSEPATSLPDLFDAIDCCILEDAAFAHLTDYQQSFISINDLATLDQYEAIIARRNP